MGIDKGIRYSQFCRNKIYNMKKMIASLALGLTMLIHAQAQKAEVYSPGGTAIKGYDPVAFFTDGKAVKGSDKLMYSWHGASWQFATQKNLDMFKANPDKYAPQYGGYCAYGTAQGHKAPIEIDTWTIAGNKLYFNYDQDVKSKWMKDQPGYIRKADMQWPSIKNKD